MYIKRLPIQNNEEKASNIQTESVISDKNSSRPFLTRQIKKGVILTLERGFKQCNSQHNNSCRPQQ